MTTATHGLPPHHQLALGSMASAFATFGITLGGAGPAEALGAVAFGLISLVTLAGSVVTYPQAKGKRHG